MKKTLQNLLKALSGNLSDIPFEIRFWDGETETYGNGVPAFILTFNTKAAAKRIFSKGTLGFREEYVAGNIGLLHTVGKECNTPGNPWTMKYIFPGGYIPTLDHVIGTMGRERLVPVDIENLRLHYAKTLDEWGKRFEANRQRIEEMFDKKLVRMWRMYLYGSAAAFRWGQIRLYQILFTNGLDNSLPMTREHLYGA